MVSMDEQVVEVLKEIRDEAKQTNARLDQTNARLDQTNARLDQTNTRLESLEGGVDSLEHRLTEGFQVLAEKIDFVNRRQTESEMRLATEVVSLAEYVRDLRDTIALKLDDHVAVLDHEKRIQTLENRISTKD